MVLRWFSEDQSAAFDNAVIRSTFKTPNLDNTPTDSAAGSRGSGCRHIPLTHAAVPRKTRRRQGTPMALRRSSIGPGRADAPCARQRPTSHGRWPSPLHPIARQGGASPSSIVKRAFPKASGASRQPAPRSGHSFLQTTIPIHFS